ncbi:MAG: hypothetical protein ACAF41_05980 [Leptolyngbya sp. BL-A-14]
MTSSDQPTVQAGDHAKPLVPPEILLSVATVPLLVALVGGRALAEGVRELGLFSEEIFRGDRLPVLNFPSATPTNPDDRAAS